MPNKSDPRHMRGREGYIAFNSNFICAQCTVKVVTDVWGTTLITFVQLWPLLGLEEEGLTFWLNNGKHFEIYAGVSQFPLSEHTPEFNRRNNTIKKKKRGVLRFKSSFKKWVEYLT